MKRRLAWGGIWAGSVLWLLVIFWVLRSWVLHNPGPKIWDPAMLGTFLSGALAPLALIWFAAIYYWQARAMREALTLQIVSGIRADFEDPRFVDHGEVINKFIDECKGRNEKYWVVFRTRRNSGSAGRAQVDLVDKARRAFSDICFRALVIDDDELVKKAIPKGLVNFLHETIWKLEVAREPEFPKKERFKRLWRIHGMPEPKVPDFEEPNFS